MAGQRVTLVGNITRDPELRFTNTGQATASFGLAVNRRWQNRQTQEWEEATSFFDVVCWREMAENAAETLTRGSRVIVTGRLEQRSWETPTATSARRWRSWPTRSDRASAGPPRRSPRTSVAGPGDGPSGGGGGGGRGRTAPQRRTGRTAGTDTARSPSDGKEQRSWRHHARRAPKDNGRRVKKKPCALCKDRVEWVDYKDVAMLRKYMSDRGKIRSRRVSGNCAQHQRDVAIAIKTARELVLLPYTQRTTTERPGGRGGRGGRDGGCRWRAAGAAARSGRSARRARRPAIPDGTPPAADEEVEVVEVDSRGAETGARRSSSSKGRVRSHEGPAPQPMWTGSASGATSSMSPAASPATTCSRRARPSWPPMGSSRRPPPCAGRGT